MFYLLILNLLFLQILDIFSLYWYFFKKPQIKCACNHQVIVEKKSTKYKINHFGI